MVLPGIETWARSDILVQPVEACRPLARKLRGAGPHINSHRHLDPVAPGLLGAI